MKENKEDTEIIEYIYQNCKLEEDSIVRTIKFKKNEDELNEILNEILNEYKKIEKCSKEMLKRRNIEPKKISIISKIVSDIDVRKNTLKEDNKNLINMLENSSKILIIQINSKLEEYDIKRKSVLNLLQRLIKLQENIIEKLEKIK